MVRFRLSSLVLPVLMLLAGNANATELQLRQVISDQVRTLVRAHDIFGLNALEHQYRTTRERTPSGTWKLQEFYDALEAELPSPAEVNNCRIPAETLLDEWSKATPDSPVPHIMRASLLLQRAWCFRGDDYASKVPDSAWQPFRENVAAAAKVLSGHKAVASVDPQYYAVMEDIYRSEGREPDAFRKLLDEATAKEPYYYGLYWSAYTYYQPQWFGSPEDVDALARLAVERTQSKDGTGAYARFYWYASSLSCGCWLEAIDCPTMKAAMRDIAQRYPDPWN